MEELQVTHRNEQCDLQARITQKKKSATKKTRKGINEECNALERQLMEKQDLELAQLAGKVTTNGENKGIPKDEPEMTEASPLPDQTNSTRKSLESLSLMSPLPSTHPERPRKQNRQKARLARRAAEQEALAAKAAEEAASQPDLREQERIAMLKELRVHGLREKEIRPDGHCLYSAVADQLTELGMALQPRIEPATVVNGTDGGRSGLGHNTVRMVAANFIAENPDDFIPFLEEPLSEYLRKIRDTAEWGGQLELLALARAYGVRINVLQGDGTVVNVGESMGLDKEVWLAYYRHSFGLGEHYNSLRKEE
ncbi:MAG: hypothetical protein M1840_004367 [Geoglossum simile]|nr:MAG: hypothetical protein M1840_004367 [Geoglossum simile]